MLERRVQEAGTIVRVVDGRTHRLREDSSLEDAYAWMRGQRELWERKLDVVDAYLQVFAPAHEAR